jgi:hypothetical protein
MKAMFVCFLNLVVILDFFSQDSVAEYYNEIACKAEYSVDGDTSSYQPRRWKKDIKIFVKGTTDSVICSELEKVVSELNELIETIEIKITDDEMEANLLAFFGWFIDYDKIEPVAEPFTAKNYGLSCVYSDANNDNYKGSFYVDVVRSGWFSGEESNMLKRHILREELTQSLGLLNDSMKYPDSIFYEDWSLVTEFSELDKEIIRRHYRN